MNQKERREYLIKYLLDESSEYRGIKIPYDEDGQKHLLRGLINVRMPSKIDKQFLDIQDAYLKEALNENGTFSLSDAIAFSDGMSLWQGDITRLEVDAIVDAANSQMTGCYQPNHTCIDNCIHTFSGVQLRLKCAEIMDMQGHDEPAGQAKITPGYNLPCKYVLHTVGPIIYDKVQRKDEDILASCYLSCLELAEKYNCNSIAFCCISTGVFRFPNRRAAEIAIQTIKKYKEETGSRMDVIFNVWKDIDRRIYEELLRQYSM